MPEVSGYLAPLLNQRKERGGRRRGFRRWRKGNEGIALDFGTGSGCLAVALAAKCPSAQIYAIDVSAEALEVARQNAARHGLAERIEFRRGDGFQAVPPEIRFDLIISNPPYIPSAEIETLQEEVRTHTYQPGRSICFITDGPKPREVFAADFRDRGATERPIAPPRRFA